MGKSTIQMGLKAASRRPSDLPRVAAAALGDRLLRDLKGLVRSAYFFASSVRKLPAAE
jgi:hypothetical protein